MLSRALIPDWNISIDALQLLKSMMEQSSGNKAWNRHISKFLAVRAKIMFCWISKSTTPVETHIWVIWALSNMFIGAFHQSKLLKAHNPGFFKDVVYLIFYSISTRTLLRMSYKDVLQIIPPLGIASTLAWREQNWIQIFLTIASTNPLQWRLD